MTANDFEYSWKRTISPELAADYAYQFFGIVGAQEYNSCTNRTATRCKDKVGVKATDEHTLQVKLTSPQPWFVQQVAHTSFLAVNKKAVEKFGDKWTEPENIVTDGPFKLAAGSTTRASTSSRGRLARTRTTSPSSASTAG